MLFSCHTFPKRLAAAPIVASEGGLLSSFFRPPAAGLLSDGFIERECGPDNGQHHDIMLLMWAKIIIQIYAWIPLHGTKLGRMCTQISHAIRSIFCNGVPRVALLSVYILIHKYISILEITSPSTENVSFLKIN